MGCVGISELEYAPINTDFVESGFAHFDLATSKLCGAGMDACIGVAHASMLGAFQTGGGRQALAKKTARKAHKATGASSAGIAFDPACVDANAAKLEITSFFKLPKKERWEIMQHPQRRYQDDVVEASRGALWPRPPPSWRGCGKKR